MARFLILSCDGGGVRGVVTLTLLERLCEAVPGLLGRFDLFTGTSTGGIISMGLASGRDADEILRQYTTLSETIFKQRYSLEPIALGILVAAIAIGFHLGWSGWVLVLTTIVTLMLFAMASLAIIVMTAKYAPGPLRKAVDVYLPGNPPLGTLARKVLVTTFRVNRMGGASWQPTFFTNLMGAPNGTAFRAEAERHGVAVVQDIAAGDAAIGTGSAPTYFPSHAFSTPSGEGNFVDGGVYANNPCVVGLAAARSLGHPLRDICVLSLGTGSAPSYVASRRSLDWGIWPWISGHDPVTVVAGEISGPPLVDVILDGPQQAAIFQARQILGDSGYCRLNVPLNGRVALDDAAAIPDLIRQTDAWVDGNPKAWQDAVAWATAVCEPDPAAAADL